MKLAFLGVVGAAFIAGSAHASFTASATSLYDHDLAPAPTPVGPGADTFGAAMTIFGGTFGQFYSDGGTNAFIADLGVPSSLGIGDDGSGALPTRELMMDSVVNDLGGGTLEFVLTWSMADGGTFLDAAATYGGDFVTQMGFEMGENNAPADLIDGTFSIVSSTFELLDGTGADLFGGTGTFFSSDNGGAGLSGVTFVQAGGADLAGFGIVAGVATITVTVPAPGAVALLGLAGFVGRRRRRA